MTLPEQPMNPIKSEAELRETVNTDECMLYAGYKSDRGYGFLTVDGKRYRTHSLLYEQIHGQIPDDLVPDHLCENPPCFNPDHIEPVTHQENIRRGMLKHRIKYCKKGLHIMAGDNLREYPTPQGNTRGRSCRECDRKTKRERYAEQTVNIPKKSSKNGKLTDIQAVNIRHMKGELTSRAIGSLYGISQSYVVELWKNKWRKV